jgi:UDP-GlcNAc:undecaprenyl-phosphate/decaprenyl-phosphate GlcNAc-1-phosphate transferase
VAATLFFVVLIATFVTMVLIPPLVRLAQWLHMVDVPSDRKVHKAPIPRLGGLAMAIGATLPLIMWAPMPPPMVAFLGGVAIILFFGAWDDIKGIDYRLKFLGQFIAVLIVVLYGGVLIRYVPFFGLEPLPDYLAIPLTVFALVGVTNAINLADGLDGLAGGITLLSLGIIAILAYATADSSLVLACAAVIGSIIGFLRFNTYPARIFMGDGGSQFLGFSAGVLVVMLTQQSNTALSPALPMMVLGLPLLDTVMVMTERLYEGRSPFLPDKKHIHHKLLALGFDHYEAVFVIYFLQSLLVAAAYFLRFEADWLILALYGLFCAVLVGFLKTAAAAGWRAHTHRHEPGVPIVPQWLQWLRRDQRILKIAFYVAVIAIPSYLLLGAFFVEGVPRDIGALAWVLLIVLVALYFRHRHNPFNIVERACAYIAGICVVYLVEVRPGALADFNLYRNMLFVAMTVAVVIGFRFSKERFRITPMDFLVVFLALVVPNLPDVALQAEHVGMGVAMLIVLFYGIELVLNNIWRRWDVMRFTTYITLAVLGLRGAIGALG